ncbi:hypothetical protein HYW43_04170 [Candidatus Daviesbacteria bacterium]|nr:hypothetical protein [Candidatus Daviesbacteria bacterium]
MRERQVRRGLSGSEIEQVLPTGLGQAATKKDFANLLNPPRRPRLPIAGGAEEISFAVPTPRKLVSGASR